MAQSCRTNGRRKRETVLKPEPSRFTVSATVQARRHIDVLYRPERTARSAVRTVLAELRRAARGIQDRDTGKHTIS